MFSILHFLVPSFKISFKLPAYDLKITWHCFADLMVHYSYFQEAAKMVQPSSRREGFNTIPNVKWEDVGGLDSLRKEFERYIVRRIKNPEDYEVIATCYCFLSC